MDAIKEFIIFFPVFIIAMMSHEVAHAWVAYMCGDNTAKYMGRLSFNPLVHIDPIGTIMLPLLAIMSGSRFLIGWAKPVPINPFNFGNHRRDIILVSLAGITANLFLAAACAAAVRLSIFLGLSSTLIDFMRVLLLGCVYLNCILAIFNLVPIPPLDGSKIVMSIFPNIKFMQQMEMNPVMGIITVMIVIGFLGRYLISLPAEILAGAMLGRSIF